LPEHAFLPDIRQIYAGFEPRIAPLTDLSNDKGREAFRRSHGPYLVNGWILSAEPFEKIARYDRPDTGAYLALISLLPLGLWAAIWGAVVSLFSATL
jgi:hypothetical protein